MQFTTSTLLFIVTIASIPTPSEAVFKFLFNTLLRPLVGPACDLAQEALGLEGTANCDCDLSYQGIFRGFKGEVVCDTDIPQCFLPPDLFCATAELKFQLAAGLFVDTGLNSNISACFDVKSGFPDLTVPIADFDNEFCFQFSPKGLELDKCSVQISSKACTSCEICESGVDFKFNCSNIDLEKKSEVITVPGPEITKCIGLSAIPTNFTA